MAGYSGTPLAKKLGFKPPLTVLTVDAPAGYRRWLAGLESGIEFTKRAPRHVDAAHVFVTKSAKLRQQAQKLRRTLDAKGFVWVSWPKKSSGVPTDVTEDTIRAIALPLGFVDVKVCTVDDVWSVLKLVIRRSER